MSRITVRSLLVLSLALVVDPVVAQTLRRVPRYVPPTPTTSRYLNLLRNDASAVTNYYGIIRRQEQQSQLIARQQVEQRAEIDSAISAIQDSEVQPTGQRSWFGVPSQRNTYRDTTHYFMRWDSRRLPNRTNRR